MPDLLQSLVSRAQGRTQSVRSRASFPFESDTRIDPRDEPGAGRSADVAESGQGAPGEPLSKQGVPDASDRHQRQRWQPLLSNPSQAPPLDRTTSSRAAQAPRHEEPAPDRVANRARKPQDNASTAMQPRVAPHDIPQKLSHSPPGDLLDPILRTARHENAVADGTHGAKTRADSTQPRGFTRPLSPDVATELTEVHIHIGRIDVQTAGAAAPARRPSQPRKPRITLEEHLARRGRRAP